ncbi:trehalose-phosphatase [Thermoleophilia bacterium SCSIO 60948]|nr:trehalose-phosphatase [Thermoleophilia bacterium SCSIO 60948]
MSDASSEAAIETLLEPLRRNPETAAVLLDIDGTLAPIAGLPEDVVVPESSLELIERLVARYGLVACISGRQVADARKLVPVEGLEYAGNHGFERLAAGASEPEPDPAVAGWEDAALGVLEGFERDEIAGAGLRLEDKGPIQAIHWRGSDSPEEAEALAGRIGERAEAEGLIAHRGRMIVELRPDVEVDKGTAVRGLLGDRFGAALYGGDDRTDLDAFAALEGMRERSELETIARVGVLSPDGPPELVERSDAVVDGVEDFVRVLEVLAR